jgi:hypothetical protein
MYRKLFQTTILAHAVGILQHLAVISQERPFDLLGVEETMAKSVDGDLRAFGDSGEVCLGARLTRKAEALDPGRRYEKQQWPRC